MTQTPTPAYFVVASENNANFVNPSAIYSEVLGTPNRSIILNDLEELRFLSQTLAHSHVLLVLKGQSAIDWSAEKSRKVISVAKLLDIKISLVWLGEKSSPKTLRDMIQESGGSAFDTKDILRRVNQICRDSVAAL